MKRWIVLAILALATPAQGQTVTPNFTQGSMTSTTVTQQTVTESISVEKLGGAYTSYSGVNITPSGAIGNPSTTYSITNAGEEFQLEIVERAAGVVETQEIQRTIQTTSTTNSLSVFSQ